MNRFENFSPEDNQTPKKKNLRGYLRSLGLAAGFVGALSASEAQDLSHAKYSGEHYTTGQGSLRYYHNPDNNGVAYAIGATRSPYQNLNDMREETQVPERLTETDFFTNFINAQDEGAFTEDPATGNPYNEYQSKHPDLDSVRYEGDYHWNIQRFLIDPHYASFGIPKDEARMNALNDIYKYFLYQEAGDRDNAWEKAVAFMEKHVDPIVESSSAAWIGKTMARLGSRKTYDPDFYQGNSNIFTNDTTCTLIDKLGDHNATIGLQGLSESPFTYDEVFDALVDYNIVYRKKTPKEAEKISQDVLDAYNQKIEASIAEVQALPLSEKKILKEPDYPDGFLSWSPEEQDLWLRDPQNAERLGKYQESFTEADRDFLITKLSGSFIQPQKR